MSDLQAGILLHRSQHICRLVGERLHCGTDQVFLGGASGQSDDGSSRLRIPVRRAKAGERGDHIHTCRIRRSGAVILRIRGTLDHAQLVPEPLNRGACNKHGSFQSILHFSGSKPHGDRGQKPVFRYDCLCARIHQQEAACPIGILYFPFLKTALPEECRLLVAGGAGNRNPVSDHAVLCPAIDRTGRHNLRKH